MKDELRTLTDLLAKAGWPKPIVLSHNVVEWKGERWGATHPWLRVAESNGVLCLTNNNGGISTVAFGPALGAFRHMIRKHLLFPFPRESV